MRLAGHVAYMGEEERCNTRFGRETLREKGHLENIGIAVRIILKCI
jgi:hypothetical protein